MGHNSNTIVAVANDGDLQQRFIAIATAEGIEYPESWVQQNRWQLAAHDTSANGLLDSYQYAVDTDPNHYKVIGRDPGVINDSMILSVVQALKPPAPVDE